MTDTETLLDALPIAAILIARDGKVTIANQQAQRLLGPVQIGRHYLMAIRNPTILDCIDTALVQGRSASTEYAVHRGAQDNVFRLAAEPVTIDNKPSVLVSFEDISPMQNARLQRRDFVANVSHELRTPLTALIGFIETLRGPARNDPAAQARFLDTMQAEADRMNRLIQDLLSLSRVESEERVRPQSPVDLAAITLAGAEALRPLADENGVTLEIAVDEGPTLVAGDADQLMQVVTNLVENAIKYGAKPGTVHISVRDADADPMLVGPALRLVVRDEGEGIDSVHIPRLTERFYRIDSHRSREVGGTGLGLAIVKHIINRHRGRMRIASAPGQGSTFTILLPRAPEGGQKPILS